ncbi:uncharacterized protein [Phyllobates terribilis]|uniref:uncharacterized protein isoform X2 n=1 Tax=Phyllobates terribilis TaxID=111132 RepID=UPI003CCA93F1
MGKCCSKPLLQEPSPRSLAELYTSVGRSRTDFYTSDDCTGPGVKRTLPSIQICIAPTMQQGEYGYKACRIMNAALEHNTGYKNMYGIRYRGDVDIIELRPYRHNVPRDFIQGIKEDIQDKIPIQETSPDPRAVIYDNYLIQEEPKQCDEPSNFIFFRSNVKDKPPKKGGYKEKILKDFQYNKVEMGAGIEEDEFVFEPIKKNNQYNPIGAGENIDFPKIEEDDSVYVLMKKDNKINPFGAGTNMDFPDGIEENEFVFVPIKKNNQYNLIGEGANIDFPDELLSFPIQETGPVSAHNVNEIDT